MATLWSKGSATVREVHTALRAERGAAYTTVMTTMGRLHRKGLLRRSQEGNAYRYATRLDRAGWLRRWAKTAIAGLVPNLDSASVAYLVEEARKANPEVLEELRRRLPRGEDD